MKQTIKNWYADVEQDKKKDYLANVKFENVRNALTLVGELPVQLLVHLLFEIPFRVPFEQGNNILIKQAKKTLNFEIIQEVQFKICCFTY